MKRNRLSVKMTASAAALLLGLSAFGSAASASAADGRVIVIGEIKGTAYVSHGGAKQIRAFTGMELRPGDRIISGNGGITLSIPDEGDRITLAAHSELAVLLLNESGGHSATKLQLLRGEAYTDVHDLTRSKDVFELSPPDQKLEIKGTQFYVHVDPVTGQSTVMVAGGVVQAIPQNNQSNQNNPSGGVLIYPGQQISLPTVPGPMERPEISYTDPSSIVSSASPEIIQAILKNMAAINEENERVLQGFLDQYMKNEEGTPNPSPALQLENQEDLTKMMQNLYALIANIAKQAGEQGKISNSDLQKIIDEANKQIKDPSKQIDLNHIPPFELPKDVSDEAKKQQEALKLKRQQEEELKKRQQEELKQKMLEDQLNKLKEQKQKLEEANKKAQEEAANKAKEQLLKQLTEEQKKQFAQEEEKRKQDENRMEPKPAAAPQPASPSPSSGGGYTPSPPVNPPVEALAFKLNFEGDPTGERMVGENHNLDFTVTSAKIDPDTKVKVKVTYTPDRDISFEGIGYYYTYQDQNLMGIVGADGVTLDYGGKPFTLRDLAENPISLRTIWSAPAKYTFKIELLQGETETSLGSYTRSFNVKGYPLIEGSAGQDTLEKELIPPAGEDPAKLGLELSLRKVEENNSEAATGQHFQLQYRGQIIGYSVSDDDGMIELNAPVAEGDQTEEEGFKLVWFMPELGEYDLTGRWFIRGEEDESEPTYVGEPFRYHYSIKAPEGTS